MEEQSDAELMRGVHDRQRAALEALYDKYVKLVFSFAMKAVQDEQASREIVQLVFTRLWTTNMRYDPAKGKFVNWIITITRNITIDYMRAQRKHSALHRMSALDHEYEGTNHTEETAIRNWRREQIRSACRALNEKQAQLIDRVYWQGYTLREVASLNEESLGTVKSRLHLALKVLRNHLNPLEGGVGDVEL